MLAQFKKIVVNPEISDILKHKSTEKAAVTTLQHMLFELGFGTELRWDEFGADGDFGNATATAIRAFASKNNLPTDGLSISPELAEKIALRMETVADLRILQKSVDDKATATHLALGSNHKQSIQALQRILHNLGFSAQLKWEEFGADGDYGNATTAAVTAFGEQEEIPTGGEAVSEEIATRILSKFTPFLGDGWEKAGKIASPLPIKRRRSRSQYERLFPVVEREARQIEKEMESYHFKKQFHEIPGESLKLDFIQLSKKDKDASYFYHKELDKERIVLHFTAGQIGGDIPTLSRTEMHVSTLFVIGRDGTAYKMFPNSKFWSYHLGPDAIGGNKTISKSSVGIEISNWGPLREDGRGGLVTWDHGHWYCNMDQTDAYIKVDEPFREVSYFAAYTPEQYESLIIILRYLTRTLDIPADFLPAGQRDQLFANHGEARAFKGICCHTNFRSSGKWDFCEAAFDWEKVIEGLNADHFKPKFIRQGTRSLFGGPKKVTEAEATEALQGMNAGHQDPDAYGEDGPEVDI